MIVAPSAVWAALARWAEVERGRFVLWLPMFMGAGTLLYLGLRVEPPAWAGVAVAVPAAIGAMLALPWPIVRAMLAALAALALGCASGQLATRRALPIDPMPSRGVTVTGQIRMIEALPAGRRVTLQDITIEESGRHIVRTVRIKLRLTDRDLGTVGDTVRIRTLLRPPQPPAYPGGWDLQRDAFFSGLGAYGQALGAIELRHHDSPNGVALGVQWLRDTIDRRIATVLPGTIGAIAATLLTGGAAAIPEPDRAAFRDSGLAHLLAVAGLHIGIVMGLVLAVGRIGLAWSEKATLFLPCREITAVVALLAGGFYLLLTGTHLPIARSFAMACLFTLAIIMGRRALSVRGLALAATVLLVIQPWEVAGVSFQMSFSAVLALISGYEALRPRLERLRASPHWQQFPRLRGVGLHIVALALTSLLAGTASAPFAAYHFGQVQIYFVLANMLAVPIAAMWVIPAGLVSLVLMPLGWEFLALEPMGWGVQVILWIARVTSALPLATFAVPHIPAWGLAILAVGIAWLGIWRTRVRLLGVVMISFGLASPTMSRPPDILMSSDARLIGLRIGNQALLRQGSGYSRFTRDSWSQYWAVAPVVMPDVSDGHVACTGACRLRASPEGAVAVLALASQSPDCTGAVVLISPEPARALCPGVPLVDRFTVWSEGAVAIWLDRNGARILTDRAERGDRPWVPAAHGARGAELPVALTDD